MGNFELDRNERVLGYQLNPHDVHARILRYQLREEHAQESEEAEGIVELPWGTDVRWAAARCARDAWRIWIPRHGGCACDVEVVLCEARAGIVEALERHGENRRRERRRGSCCLDAYG